MVLHDSQWYASPTPYTKAGKGFYEREKNELLEIMEEIYNHPSVVAKAISNEMYCPDNIPMINRLYDDLRMLDPCRPIMTSTVANQKRWSGMKRELSDLHTYDGWYAGPPGRILSVGRSYNQTHEYPMITEETVCNYLLDHLGRGQVLAWQRWLGIKRHKDPIEQRKQQARIIKIQMEIERMHPEIFTGGACHFLGGIDISATGEIVRKTLAQVYSPVFVCGDIYNRNYFAGGEMENNLYCINDHQDKDIKNALAQVWLTREGDGQSLLKWEKKEINLPPLGREVMPFKLTLPDVPTGFYTLHLALKDKDNLLSDNSCRLFIMKKQDAFSPVKNKEKRTLLIETGSLVEDILKGLTLNYTKTDLKAEGMFLNEFDFVIITPSSGNISPEKGEAIKRYVAKGGRVLALNQSSSPAFKYWLPMEVGLRKGGYCFNTFIDLLRPDHPVFNGLSWENFDTWNDGPWGMNWGAISETILSPDTPLPEKGNLAQAGEGEALGHGMPAFGPVIYNFRHGDGEYLLSQICAVERYGKDPVATRYVHNLLNYMLAGASCVDLPVIKENDNMKTDMGDGPFPVDKDGFIRHWLVSGPFPNPGGRPYGTAENQKGFDNDFLSQLGGEVCVLPKAGQKTATEFPVTSEGYWNNFKGRYECAWKKIYSKSGRVDLLPEFTISDNTLAYACCYIESPEERDVKVKLGSDDGYKVWFNNVLLGGKNICRGVMEDSEEYRVHIKKGFVLNDRNLNVLLLKIIQDTGGWGFVARITDLDDKPLTDLKIWLAPAK